MERPLHKHFAKSCKNNKTEENVNIKRKKKRHHFVLKFCGEVQDAMSTTGVPVEKALWNAHLEEVPF